MSAKESTEQGWLRKHVVHGHDFLLRVENLLGEGTFDTFCCVMGAASWIEIKAPVEPARETTRLFSNNHQFTQGQKNFAMSILKARGTCWGFIGTNMRQMLIPGNVIEHANDMTVQELLAAAAWSRDKNTPLVLSARHLRFKLAQRPYEPPPYEVTIR